MIVEIKRELRKHPELLQNDTIEIDKNDGWFLRDCEQELQSLRYLRYDDVGVAIRNTVSAWEYTELERLGIVQTQNW